MPKKVVTKTQKAQSQSEELEKKDTSFFDYLRFGESYTSLILGIIVVIITTALLLSFVHNKNAGNVNTPISQQTQNTVQLTQQTQDLAKKAPDSIDTAVSIGPTATHTPTKAPQPTVTPKPTAKPTTAPKPTAKPTIKATPMPTQKPKATPTVTKQLAKVSKKIASPIKTKQSKNVWIVQKGESLWTIAQKKYTTGYNWVDIAKANKLTDPSDIHVGDTLILPSVAPKQSTIAVSQPTHMSTNVQQNTSNNITKITGSSYTVVRGDNLWNIAVRAYGDGYRWTDIAQANHLANPHMIFSGNVLVIPRN